MSVYRTREDWKKKGREIKPSAVVEGKLLCGDDLFSKAQTCFKWELVDVDFKPDSWYLGSGEEYY